MGTGPTGTRWRGTSRGRQVCPPARCLLPVLWTLRWPCAAACLPGRTDSLACAGVAGCVPRRQQPGRPAFHPNPYLKFCLAATCSLAQSAHCSSAPRPQMAAAIQEYARQVLNPPTPDESLLWWDAEVRAAPAAPAPAAPCSRACLQCCAQRWSAAAGHCPSQPRPITLVAARLHPCRSSSAG